MTAPAHTELYDQVYREFMENAKDPAWRFAMGVFCGELMQDIATYHQAQIQAIVDWAAERQLNRQKSAITKRYLIEKLTEVRKNHPGGALPGGMPAPAGRPSDYNPFNESLWTRDAGGRFARYNGPDHVKNAFWRQSNGKETPLHERGIFQPHDSDPRSLISRAVAMRPEHERSAPYSGFGVINKPTELPTVDAHGQGITQSQHAVDVANKFNEMTWSLAQATGNHEDKQRVQFVISSPDGYHRVVTPKAGEMPDLRFGAGERVQFMTPVGPDNPVTIAGQVVNIGAVAGMSPEQAAKMGAVAADVHGALLKTSFGDKLQHSANAARLISNNHPMAVQAHAVAQLFNVLGPDASRAFGNKLKQLTYRYSGQEAGQGQLSEVARRGRAVQPNGKLQDVRDYERQLAFDLSPAIPSATEYKTALQAGSSPPSRGYILNDDGRVVSEAVGYADDWYTPFNLKKLPQMSGGSYIRTRGYGGLTPEDIRLAMRTGAKRATVISNNGVFTMEFNPKALNWGHRFGFLGNSLIKRYAKALDAIQNGAVEAPDGQLNAQGKKVLSLDTTGYVTAMRDLQRKNPYWIGADNEKRPMHQSLKEFGNIDRATVVGEEAKDLGYMGPLDVHAAGAMDGWHDPAVREIWYEGDKAKYAANSVDKGRVHFDAGLGLVAKLRDGKNGVGAVNIAPGRSASTTYGGASTGSRYGGSSTPSSGAAKYSEYGSGTGVLGVNNIRQGTARVDPSGFLKDYQNRYVDPTGKILTPNEARAAREIYAEGNPLLRSPGHVIQIGTGSSLPGALPTGHTSYAVGANGQRTFMGVPEATIEEERKDKRNHWTQDEALEAVGQTKDVLTRLKEMGHLPRSTANWKALHAAHQGLMVPNWNEDLPAYADLVDKVQVSPTYRAQLATDLEDAIDADHLSNDFTELEPGRLLATLRGQEFNRVDAAPAHHPSEPLPDERGDSYASLDIGKEILPQELSDNVHVKAHVAKLEKLARTQGDSVSAAKKAQAEKEWGEYHTFAKVNRRVHQVKQQATDANRPVPSTQEILAREPEGLREMFFRLTPYYKKVMESGAAQDLDADWTEGREDRALRAGRAISNEGRDNPHRETWVSDEASATLPSIQDYAHGDVELHDMAEAMQRDIENRYGKEDPLAVRSALRNRIKVVHNAAARLMEERKFDQAQRMDDLEQNLQSRHDDIG